MDRYRLGAELLEGNSSEKNLAVLADNRLTMSSSVSLWPRRPLGALKKKAWLREIIFPLYSATVRSHLDYCVQFCAPQFKADRELLERVQQSATKMIRG